MRQLDDHPLRTLAGLLGLAFGLFLVSGIPAVKDARGWTAADAVGYVSWFGFLLCALLFLVAGGYAALRAMRRRYSA